MPTKKIYSIQLTPFEERVREALAAFYKNKELEDSPLSSPYFLSHLFANPNDAMVAEKRTEKLQRILIDAVTSLWEDVLPTSNMERECFSVMKSAERLATIIRERETPETKRYSYLILNLQYLDDEQQNLKNLMDEFDKTNFRNNKKVKTSDIWEYLLLTSKPTYYRELKVAIRHVSEALLKYFNPPLLHAELPVRPQKTVGRETIQGQVVTAIHAGKSVGLIGAGGSGKTTLAAEVMHRFREQGKPIFWYVFRSTFNDHLDSLLFSLGHFLNEQGASNLWRFLLAHLNRNELERDPKKNESALLLVKADLAELRNNSPLLCFDELDRLRSEDTEDYSVIHQQMIEFIEGIRNETPTLLIGQRAMIETNELYTLEGLDTFSIGKLWQAWGSSLRENQLTQLAHLTKGNPRLLNICLLWQQEGESLEHILATLPNKPVLVPFFDKLWKRLASDEKKRRLLLQLSVFHNVTPASYWQRTEQETIKALLAAHLLEEDGKGGIAIIPAFREIIYNNYVTDPTLRANLHVAAARIRTEFAEYTSAAYHYGQAYHAGQTERAIDAILLWFPRMTDELQQGQAGAAWNIFRHIAPQSLADPTQARMLCLIQSKLSWLQADLPGGLELLQAIKWDGNSELTLRAKTLQADFQDALGDPDAAIESYSTAVNLIGRLVNQASHLLFQRGRILRTQQKELLQSENHTHLIEFEWRRMQGVLHEANGRYRDATIAYQTGLAIAQSLGEFEKVAWMESSLARLLGLYLQRTDEAYQHLQRAICIYQKRGDLLNQARAQLDWTNLLLTDGKYQEAVDLGISTYQVLRTLQDVNSAADLGATLAEAYFELGDFLNAERYAQQVVGELESRHAYPYALHTMARLKRQNRETWQIAYRYLENAKQIARSNRDSFILAYLQREVGQLYFDQAGYKNAKLEWESAFDLFTQQGSQNESEKTYQLLLHLPRNTIII